MKNVINHHGLRYRAIILAISLALLLSVAVGDAAAFTEGCYQAQTYGYPDADAAFNACRYRLIPV